ncbi:MAG: hypothetical protein GF375_00825 [Candidatus Omnitrophica bacterium]|nr:hypothetical protein [Candidatus Omnitrophota bacterium]
MRRSLGSGAKREWLGSEKDNMGSMLLRLAENYIMAPQNVVPAFAQPFKVTTPPGDGLEIPPQGVGPGETFYTGVSFNVPVDSAAIVTCLHQELESPAAYSDVNIRLYYRGGHKNFWNPQKPEITPCKIVVFEKETIEIQWENNGLVSHWFKGEIIGYWFNVPKPDKNQRGLTVPTQSQG